MRRSVRVRTLVVIGWVFASACSSVPSSPTVSDPDEVRGAAPSCDGSGLNEVALEALTESNAAGAVVVIDLATGAEVAAVSNAERLDTAAPPASTVKAFLARAALEGGVVTPDESLPCNGEWAHGEQTLQCFHDHGELDLAKAVATSCNSYFYEVVQRLGTEKVADTFESFGLVGLGKTLREAPEEQRMAIAVGHGTGLVTPRELAAAFANLVTTPSASSKFVHAGMLDAVASAHGTARKAAVPGMAVAGKTGTAESTAGNHAWFVGYAPANAPRVLVLAYLDGDGMGGSLAAPVAAQVLTAWSETCQ